MPARRAAPSRTLLTLTALAAIGSVLALSGCASSPAPEPTQSSTPASAPTTPPPAPDADALTCDEILPVSALNSALGASFTLNTAFTPDPGSVGAQLAAAGGVACEWTDGSGASVLAAAGEPGVAAIEAGESEAARAGSTTDVFGASLTGYVSGAGGSIIDVFSEGGAWVQTASSLYTSPADAAPVIEQIMQALPSGG